MSYRKMVRFQWAPGHIFPVYPPTSGSHASQRRVNKLKPVAVAILTEEATKVRRAFQTLARGRAKGIQLDLDAACVKIENARMSPESGGLHGESDGDTIWISKNKINDAELLGVLLHESLHYCCTMDGRDICEKDEHRVMRALGDDC